MTLSMHSLSVGTFVPMLGSLKGLIGKGAGYAEEKGLDPATLVNAKLAPDMFTLAKQVQVGCDQAKDSVAHLTGIEAPRFEAPDETLGALEARIDKVVAYLDGVDAAAFAGAETRGRDIPLPDGRAISMTGVEFLRDWALPHFYFHVVTAYDILRHAGVEIGKRDYMTGVARFIRPAPASHA